MSPIEVEKAAHFNFQKDRERYIAAHGILREIIGRYTLAVYAFALKRKIGIDIEFIRSDVVKDSTAEYSFSSCEIAQLRSLPAASQTKAFFNCWTRKEAFIKAKGEGLSIPLNQFDVSLIPNKPACLLRTEWDTNEAKRWSLSDLERGVRQ